MKQQRKKKEQKEVIKNVVQKQLNKNPRSKVIKEEAESEEPFGRGVSLEDEEPLTPPSRNIFKSRIRGRH